MKYRAVKGMNDILPDEARRFERVERIFRETVSTYGFEELRTPIVEDLALFQKSTGETSEVVQKQMFLLDRERESLALRPEGTPSSARAYIESKRYSLEPITKWFYIGPMFRAERPQRGRYRQFHQAGCELYGDAGPLCDAEMIDMLFQMTERFGLKNSKVLINSLGSPEARIHYRKQLTDYFSPHRDRLSEHAQERLGDNPLRILDSKDPRDVELSRDAPLLLDSLTSEDLAHFDGVKSALDRLGTPYQIDARLVRGLDYYSRTCFEIVAESGEIGSQSAIVGGGRYDAMLEGLGGPPTSAIGFAMGLERILLALGDGVETRPPLCFLAPIGQQAALECLLVAQELRRQGVRTELEGRQNSLKSMLRRANSMGARFCVVMGKEEVENSQAQLKDLQEHTQQSISLSEVASVIINALRSDESMADGVTA